MKCVSDVCLVVFFLLNDTATTEIYTLSLHDALPISDVAATREILDQQFGPVVLVGHDSGDRKSTRLNSSHANISYAVFFLKKKNSSQLSRTSLGTARFRSRMSRRATTA